jgi:hypothetical protein
VGSVVVRAAPAPSLSSDHGIRGTPVRSQSIDFEHHFDLHFFAGMVGKLTPI